MKFIICIFLVLFSVFVQSQDIKFSMKTDKDIFISNDIIEVAFTLSTSDYNNDEFSKFKPENLIFNIDTTAFKIVSKNVSFSSRYLTSKNVDSTKTTSKELTWKYSLKPLKTGTFTLKPAEVNSLKSNELTLKIIDSNSDEAKEFY